MAEINDARAAWDGERERWRLVSSVDWSVRSVQLGDDGILMLAADMADGASSTNVWSGPDGLEGEGKRREK